MTRVLEGHEVSAVRNQYLRRGIDESRELVYARDPRAWLADIVLTPDP
jgi:hypothetical protein